MATTEEINQKHSEFQGAVSVLQEANTTYEATVTPYLEAKAALVAAIAEVDRIDNELEALTAAYEPPAAPEPK